MTTQIQTRLKCGEVYTWNCAGEAYAIECALCEERPLCTLAEFADHMDVWHSSWDEETKEVERSTTTPQAKQTQTAVEDEDSEEEQEAQSRLAFIETLLNNQVDENIVEDEQAEGAIDVEQELDLEIDKAQLQLDITEQKNLEHSALTALLEPFEEVLIADDDVVAADEKVQVEEAIVDETNDGVVNAVDGEDDIIEEHTASVNAGNECFKVMVVTSDTTCESEPEPTELSLQDQIQYGLNEPYINVKLTKEHVEKLIDLYREHPRVWNQTHPEYSETHLSRLSWQDITEKWNHYCQKSYTTTDVRIRVSTLCQRYMKERERLENEGEVDTSGKFVHFDRLQFLDDQQTLQTRRLIFEQQNAKLLEIYVHFPLLWHSHKKHVKLPEEREKSLRSISTALELCGIYLSPFAVQRRLKALRKCYRIEKIRFLHCRVEQRTFETNFKHYDQMQFLDKHIDPYVCAICGKIFENLLGYREHINNENHGDWSAAEEEDDESDIEKEENEIEEEVWQEKQQEANEDVVKMAVRQAQKAVSINFNISFANEINTPVEGSNCTEASTEVAAVAVDNNSNKPSEILADISGNINSEKKSTETAFEIKPTEFSPLTATTKEAIPNTLVAKVECGAYTYDLNLNATKENEPDSTTVTTETKMDIDHIPLENGQSFARLTVEQTHKLIELYKMHPQLWDPNHLDHHSRKQRRIAWRILTAKLNKLYKTRYIWKTLHRKLTDYTKYYKREKNRIETERSCTKWCFYDGFSFLDDVIIINSELQKTMQHRDNNLKIIEVYKMHPQLWDTHHAEYTKRKLRQRYIESMCGKLQECNLQITSERLKQRLIEFRNQYRAAKEARIEALQRNEIYTPTYDFYEALQYLELHVAPFICSLCGASFKRHTDFVLHERRLHASSKHSGGGREKRAADAEAAALENVCHICGMTFTLRSNLVLHLQRHMGARTHACTYCPKRFFNTTALRVHERSHTKNYPCVCELCGRRFVNASKLNQHAKRHRNQRDFPCDRCDKAFFSAFERERHLRRHLQIRDKVCEVCGKAFVVGSAYYAHKMIHADVKKYECVQCNVRFAQYAGLYKHRKKFHP